MKDHVVEDSEEFRRIMALPRRIWEVEIAKNDLYKRVSLAFRLPIGQQELRPIQAAALADAHDIRGLLAPIRVGEGKCQPNTEPVLLDRGWVPIGEVCVGDRIYGSDGRLNNVLGVYPQGVRPIYKISFSDNTWALSDIDHLWTLSVGHRKEETRRLRDWLKEPLFRESSGQRINRLFLPMLKAPVMHSEKSLPLDPYTLGALLGDGGVSQRTPSFTSMDKDIVDALKMPAGVTLKPVKHQNSGRATQYSITGKKKVQNPLTKILEDLGLQGRRSETKFIPNNYKYGSVTQRWELLCGLLDTDGEVAKTRSMFSSASPQLAEDVAQIVEGLGGTAYRQYRHNHTRIGIQLPRGWVPFKCQRKRVLYEKNQGARQRGVFRAVTNIEYVGDQAATCIRVSAPDSLYVTRFHVLTHNTLISFLLPVVVQNIRNPVLLLPAALVEKTWNEFQELKKHWLCHPAFATRAQFDKAVISYEKLGRDSGKNALMQLERVPDMIISDECHRLRNRQAACTKRFERFMMFHPECVFAGMSGTITKRSIRDYWHLLKWALKGNSPLPLTEKEMEMWSEALDERRIDVLSRRDPGVLLELCTKEERASVTPKRTAPLGRTDQMPNFVGNLEEKLVVARTGYQRRLRETPGIICSPDKNLDCSLVIRRQAFDPGPQVMKHIEHLREEWETPNGDALALPVDVWRHARELACGFYYRWDPPPPSDWLQARKRWNWYVRQVLTPPELIRRKESPFGRTDGALYEQYKNLHLDSPFQVANAIIAGVIQDPHISFAYSEWNRVKDSYKINVVADWISDSTLNFCCEWVKKNGNSILWTEHRAFGEELARRLGTGFCSNGGLDARGNTIESYAGKTVVASVAANKEGRNLQAWYRNFIITAPPNGALHEQLLGRTHRMGQEEDTVYVDWLCACAEQDEGFSQLMADARYIQQTTGQSQKLLYADHI